MHLSRRGFLAAFLSSVAWTVVYADRVFSAGVDRRATESLGGMLGDIFADKESARVLGFEYLAGHPAERNAALLVQEVFRRNRCRPPSLQGKLRTRREVRRQISDDFEAERVVRVRGWILSQTEARLCALAALLDSEAGFSDGILGP